MKRGFKEVVNEKLKNKNVETKLPTRSDTRSAGYDFYSKETVTIKPYEAHLFWSDVKTYMLSNEYLSLHVRSSLGIKGLRLLNQTGIIDSSYYSNEANDGNIGLYMQNHSENEITIQKNDRIAQGIFQNYLIADDDIATSNTRNGGFGSTGK